MDNNNGASEKRNEEEDKDEWIEIMGYGEKE